MMMSFSRMAEKASPSCSRTVRESAGNRGIELQVGPVFAGRFRRGIDAGSSVGLDHRGFMDAELFEQDAFCCRIEILFQFELDHLSAAPSLESRCGRCASRSSASFPRSRYRCRRSTRNSPSP